MMNYQIRAVASRYNGTSGMRPSNIGEKKGSYDRGGLTLEVIFSMIKHFLFNKTRSDNGVGLIPEVPLYIVRLLEQKSSYLLLILHRF